MKQNLHVSVYDTTSTEMTAALMALGFDLVETDPIRRIFTENRPCNAAVTHGLQRGGEVQYRLETESDQFSTKVGLVAQAYCERESDAEKASLKFDAKVEELREKVKGTEAGIMLEHVISALPSEIARYVRLSMDTRRKLISEIATRKDMVEMVKIRKSDGHFVLHHVDCPAEIVEELCA